MLKYTARRFFEMLLTLFIIATATFFLLEAVPGDPLLERVNACRKRLPKICITNMVWTIPLLSVMSSP